MKTRHKAATPSVWTAERNEQLRALYKLPINQEEIARRLSDETYMVSLMAVNAQIQKLRLKRTPEVFAQMKKVAGGNKTAHHGWTAERTDELEKLVALGLSGSQIAEKMGLSRNQVVGRSHRCGFKLSGGAAQEARVLSNVAIRPKKRRVAALKLVEGGMKPSKPALDLSRVYNGETVPFSQSGRFQCRYIIDAEATADARTCAAHALPGSTWCSTHRAICFVPPQPRRRTEGNVMNATWRASK